MKKMPIVEFEKLLTKSNIEHKAKDYGNTVELDVFGLRMYVTNANPINDERLERLMVHVGYPKPGELLTFIFLLKIIELYCTINGVTFEEIAFEELDRRGLFND